MSFVLAPVALVLFSVVLAGCRSPYYADQGRRSVAWVERVWECLWAMPWAIRVQAR